MAEYKGIHGTKIRNYTTNPDNTIQGEVWYNETDNVLKFQYTNVTTSGSWATGGTMNTARADHAPAQIGTKAATLAFGGASPGLVALTEQYNGASWSEVNDLNTAKSALAGAGTSTAALGFGGYVPPGVTTTNQTETWNGTNWTEVNDMNLAREAGTALGDNSSSLLFVSGSTGSRVTNVEEWNGVSWAETADVNTKRNNLAASGSATAGVVFGGGDSGISAATEEWSVPSSTTKVLTD